MPLVDSIMYVWDIVECHSDIVWHLKNDITDNDIINNDVTDNDLMMTS